MNFKKWISLCCMAFSLTLAVPIAASATGTPEAETEPAAPVQTNGWSEDHTYYLQDGKKITGVHQLSDGYYYFFDGSGTLLTGRQGYVRYNKAAYFVKPDGTLLRNSWGKADGNYYYAGDSAKLHTNTAARIGGKIYCFNTKSVKLTNGLKKIKGNTYLLAASGAAKTGIQLYNGKRYFFNTSNGRMMKNRKIKYNGKLFFATTKGPLVTGWKQVGDKTYYADSKGRLKTGWQTYQGKRYYFNQRTGALRSGWVNIDGRYYYYTPSGSVKTGWFKVGKNTYYGTPSGPLKGARLIEFQRIGGKRYLFNTRGVLLTGWQNRNGHRYYMDSKGVVTTGWRKIKSQWYFFESSGAMKTGWLVHNGNFYYMNPKTGAMTTGRKTIGGQTYTFASSGIYTQRTLSGSWVVKVNRAANVITVYKGNIPVKAFLCSTGMDNATPLGTFSIRDKLWRHELNGPTWGYFCSHITDDILLHSIPAPTTERTAVPSYKFNMLGQQASQGCIRLAMGDAKWLYDTVPVGSTVVVYDDASYPGPLGRPANFKMNEDPVYYYDPTDPIAYPSYSTSK